MDIEREILGMSIPINKTYGVLPCPIKILSGAKHIISGHYHYQHLCARIRRRLSTEIKARESNFCLDLQK